jgi:hypothetical protein
VIAPVDETVARLVFADVHVTVKPVRTAPVASRAVATAWATCPTSRVAESIATVTVATLGGAARMESEELPTTPSTVA